MKLILVSLLCLLSFGARATTKCSNETRLKSLYEEKLSANIVLNEDLLIPKETRAFKINNIVFVLKKTLDQDTNLERGTTLDLLSVSHAFIRAKNKKIDVFAYFMKNEIAESIQNKTISSLEEESLGVLSINCKEK